MKRAFALWRILLVCGIAGATLASGCAVGRKWFRMDSDSGMPSLGVELRAERDAPQEKARVQGSPDESGSIRPARLAEEKQRSLIPEWLRFGGRDEAVPLPTTGPPPSGTDAAASSGPSEEFS
jgi:hypothetical protein